MDEEPRRQVIGGNDDQVDERQPRAEPGSGKITKPRGTEQRRDGISDERRCVMSRDYDTCDGTRNREAFG